MSLFTIPLFIRARDEEHAEQIRSEIEQRIQDASDSDDLDKGEAWCGDNFTEIGDDGT